MTSVPPQGSHTGPARSARGRPRRHREAAPAPPRVPVESDRRHQRAALLLALALVFVWGSNFSVQKYVFAALAPQAFLFARYLVMPACAVLLLWQRYGWRWPRLPRREWGLLLGLGVLGHVLHVGLVTFGIAWSTAFSSSLILACGPIFTLLLLRWTGTEPLSRAQVAGVGVACAGVLVFLSDKLSAGLAAGTGDLVLLAAAACFSAYTVAARPLIERHGGVLVMAYATLLGSVPLVLFGLPAGIGVAWRELPLPVWLGMAYAVVVSAFFGWIVWGWVNAVRGLARTAPLMYLMPPVAGAIAWLATGEAYGAVKLAGAAITLGGVALAQFAAARPKPEVLQSVTTVVD